MKIIQRSIPWSNFNLFLFGDLHLGNRLCYWTGVKKLVNSMNNSCYGLAPEQNLGVFSGDAIEGITVDDRRFSPDNLTPSQLRMSLYPSKQVKEIIETFKPIGNKLVVWLDGNHEDALKSFGPIAEEMAEEIGVEYGTYTCVIEYVDENGELLFKHYATHGRKSINSSADDESRREANMKLVLKRHLRDKMSDALLMSKAHTHKLLILKPKKRLHLYSSNQKIRQTYIQSPSAGQFIHPDDRWYVNTGGFLRLFGDGYSGYAEKAEYDPIELGYAVVLVRNGKILDIISEIV